jgi:flavin reductase (DIM6/NTAB) family NADH-FMN oxidoreductase RutF
MNFRRFTSADFDRMDRGFRRNFMNCLSGFKSVNLCGSIDSSGNTNLSIMSSVVHLGANPSLMGMIIRPSVVPRNTLDNILDTGSYTFNHISQEMIESAHQTAGRYEKGVSEYQEVGLTAFFSGVIAAPYVQESMMKIGLEFKEKIDIQSNGTHFIVGEVVEVMIDEKFIGTDGYIDINEAGTITVAGLDGYHSTSKITRLSHPKPGKELRELKWK